MSTEFYDELVAHAVPIDLRALKALRGSPLALDIYSWLTYRMSYLRKPTGLLLRPSPTHLPRSSGSRR